MAVASGMHDIVIAAGVEKVTDVGSDAAMDILSSSADREWEWFVGANLPSLYAMMARMHMEKFGTGSEDLAGISIKNHRNATLNPKAQFRREISMDVALNSPFVAEPLRLFDCSPISDGAAAVILADETTAKEYTDKLVYLAACSQASDYLSLQNRTDPITMSAVVQASKIAYRQANVSPDEIDIAEIHDSFTIAELIAYEDLGFVEKGKGKEMVREGRTEISGELPVNTSGGLKACGHAIGATGIRQAVEIALQLRGDAGKRQVEAEKGLALNIGGTGATAVVSIFEVA